MGTTIIAANELDSDWAAAGLRRLPRFFRRWWAHMSLSSQLAGLILGAGVVGAAASQTVFGVAGGVPGYLTRWGIVLSTVLAVVLVATRLVMRTLRRLVETANALVAGDYETVRTHSGIGASAEVRRLENAFDTLAQAIAEREQLLQSELLQMREVERLKDEFISTVSHELRTPLTSVRGALGLVLGGPLSGDLNPKARDLLRIALSNSERLIRLINDILDVEKMEAGQMTMNEQRCDLGSILRTTVAGVQSVAHDAGVRIVIEGDSIVSVSGDADRLVQVFTNLVSNAIKFSPRGEEIRLRAEVRGERVSIHVSDRGPGIAPEFRDRIFGKFQQADGSAVRRPGGTGLGLAIARAIAEMHGGTIRFETALGVGTTFTVDLPCVAAQVQSAAREQGTGPRLLIVEQDDSMRSILETLCASLAEVVGARTGEEALAATRGAPFDAIIIDPHLPDVDGFAFVRRLRETQAYASSPVLVHSTREYSIDELQGVTLAPSHAFVKSRDRESELVLRLRAVLAVRRQGTIRAAA